MRSTIFFTMGRGTTPPTIERAQDMEKVARSVIFEWCNPGSAYTAGVVDRNAPRVIDADKIGLAKSWAKTNNPTERAGDPFGNNVDHHNTDGLIRGALANNEMAERFMLAVNLAMREIFPDMPELTVWIGVTAFDPLPVFTMDSLVSIGKLPDGERDPDDDLPTLSSFTKGGANGG